MTGREFDDISLLVFRRTATADERDCVLEFLGAPASAITQSRTIPYVLIDVAAAASGPPIAAAIVQAADEAWTLEWARADEDHGARRLASELATAALRAGARTVTWPSSVVRRNPAIRRVLASGVLGGSVVIDL